MIVSEKYPRIPHLPWSPGRSSDDKVLSSVTHLEPLSLVITEKMDGENTTLTSDVCHARSLESRDHPSRHWIKSFWASIRHSIPPTMRFCGENLYAKHSIFYDRLPSYFLLFSVFDGPTCLSWSEVEEWAQLLNLITVPVLYRGPWDPTKIFDCMSGRSRYGSIQEGYVLRNTASFPTHEFASHVAKYVRASHVSTSDHWLNQPITPNILKP